MSGTCGPTSPTPFAWFDPDSSSLKTSQGIFPWDSTPSSPTLPASGSMRNGELFERPMLAPATNGPDCSLLLPTPTAGDSRGSANRTANRTDPNSAHHDGVTLTDAVRLLPTPTTQPTTGNEHARNLGAEVNHLQRGASTGPPSSATSEPSDDTHPTLWTVEDDSPPSFVNG